MIEETKDLTIMLYQRKERITKSSGYAETQRKLSRVITHFIYIIMKELKNSRLSGATL